MNRRIHSHGRSLWARSANYRRLAWTAGFLALIAIIALNRQAPPPVAPPDATPATSGASTPAPAQNTAQYTPPPKTTPAPTQNTAQYTPPPKTTPAADTRSAEERVAEAVRRAQQGGNSGSDVGVLKPLASTPADNTVANTAAPTTILDPNSDHLEDYPLAEKPWSEALHLSPANRGFNVYYFMEGDMRRLSVANPYHSDAPGYYMKDSKKFQESLRMPSFDALADFWKREPRRRVGYEHVGSIKLQFDHRSRIKNIPGEDLAACWSGKIQIHKSGYYQFTMKQTGSVSAVRILIDRHRIYEGQRNSSPRVWLDSGNYRLDVEYVSNLPDGDFALAMGLADDPTLQR